MPSFRRHFDTGSMIVIGITSVLFAVALVEKGLTHDLLLETGVFLVSVKLILMAYKNSVASAAVNAKLDRLLQRIEQLDARFPAAR